mmetsp:Transcript_18321/g.23845  ORF Transcript_18321/g.23845 Transcript_18321/m.23845 type:complete len:314 (+) Transcript_18321:32-973(+)
MIALLLSLLCVTCPVESHLEATSARIGQALMATPKSEAGEVLRRQGVVRINNVLDRAFASRLKAQILDDHSYWYDGSNVVMRDREEVIDNDPRHIPGTRLRFKQQIAAPFAGMRADILLPIEDDQVKIFLNTATSVLSEILQTGATRLPQNEAKKREQSLQLVECAALVAWPGANHQTVHADYNLGSSLPPRLVTFVYLQDVPTCVCGATVFFPESSAAKTKPPSATCALLSINIRAGDAVIYDASLLHFGAANTMPENQRVVAYFSCAKPEAAKLSAEKTKSFQAPPPSVSRTNDKNNVLIEHPPIFLDSFS